MAILHALRCSALWLSLLAATIIAGTPKAGAGVILVAAEEAKLPAPTRMPPSRAITRGPRIEVSDLEDGRLHSPFHFRLKFRAFGGAAIDVNSLAVNSRTSILQGE
jgi:hypothetical protein